MNGIKGWSYEKVIELIELYKTSDILWDPQNPHYKNRSHKKEAWESVAQAIQMTRHQVEQKIHNLRTQYTRERRKLRKHIAEHGETYEPHWFAYKHLLFLKSLEVVKAMPLTPAEKQRRYRERRENNPEKNAESKRKDLDRYHANKRLVRDLTTREHRAIKKKWRSANARQKDRVRRNSNEDSEIQYFSESQIWDPLENESSCEQPESTREVSIETPRPSKKSKTVEEEVLTTLYPNILSSQSHTNKSKDLKDDFTVFGEYIACELRRVKEEHAQAVAKHHINNIIFDAQMGKYNRVQPKSQSIPHYTETASSAHNSTEDVNNVKSEVIDNYRNMIS